jgi:hypothetical protein
MVCHVPSQGWRTRALMVWPHKVLHPTLKKHVIDRNGLGPRSMSKRGFDGKSTSVTNCNFRGLCSLADENCTSPVFFYKRGSFNGTIEQYNFYLISEYSVNSDNNVFSKKLRRSGMYHRYLRDGEGFPTAWLALPLRTGSIHYWDTPVHRFPCWRSVWLSI